MCYGIHTAKHWQSLLCISVLIIQFVLPIIYCFYKMMVVSGLCRLQHILLSLLNLVNSKLERAQEWPCFIWIYSLFHGYCTASQRTVPNQVASLSCTPVSITSKVLTLRLQVVLCFQVALSAYYCHQICIEPYIVMLFIQDQISDW